MHKHRLVFIMVAGVLAAPSAAFGFGKQVGPDGKTRDGVCGTPQPVERCERKIGQSGPQPRRTIFLNRGGGTYAGGAASNSVTNSVLSSVVPGGTVPPSALNESAWTSLKNCVTMMYAPYNIDVVDVEPAPTENYVEVVVGGTNTDIGIPNMGGGILLGIAATPSVCNVQEQGVCFVLEKNHGFSITELCNTAAHEAGHLLGLEHEVIREDLMSYESYNPKGFIDENSPCGTYESAPGPCSCGDGSTQNSKKRLDDHLGPNDLEPPTATVTSPADGGTVAPGFTVTVDATDNFSVEKVEIYIDDTLSGSDILEPWSVDAPAGVAIGQRKLDVKVWDKSSNTTTITMMVNVEPGCMGDGDCDAGQVCVDQACLGDIGHDCDRNEDCADGLCVKVGQFDFVCSKLCDEGASGSCPSGFECKVEGGGQPKCFPGEGGGGGLCQAAAGGRSGSAAGAGALAALLAGVLMSTRRRRRG